MTINPLFDNIVIQRDEAAPVKTASGLILPGSIADIPLTGVVLAVGPGRTLDSGETLPTVVQVGDRVSFGHHHSINNIVMLDRIEYLIIPETDLIAVLT